MSCPIASKVTYAPVILYDSTGKQYQDPYHAIVTQEGVPASTLYSVVLTNQFTGKITTFSSPANAVVIALENHTNYLIKAGYLCAETHQMVWTQESQSGTGPTPNISPCVITIDATKFGFPPTTATGATLTIPPSAAEEVEVTVENLATHVKAVFLFPKGSTVAPITGLNPSTWYMYKMRALCLSGIWGAYSGPGSFKTK